MGKFYYNFLFVFRSIRSHKIPEGSIRYIVINICFTSAAAKTNASKGLQRAKRQNKKTYHSSASCEGHHIQVADLEPHSIATYIGKHTERRTPR